MNCHHGPLFSDGKFHHTGLSYFGRRFEDRGRYEATENEADMSRFRTPGLRDLEFTGPWMHNGLFTNFTGILRMYNHGVTFNSRVRERSPPLSPLIRPLDLSDEEIESLEAFLKTLGRIPQFIEAPKALGFSRPDSDAVYPLPGETPRADDSEY
jgi:cytochrome c peroxidase